MPLFSHNSKVSQVKSLCITHESHSVSLRALTNQPKLSIKTIVKQLQKLLKLIVGNATFSQEQNGKNYSHICNCVTHYPQIDLIFAS